MDWKNLFLSWEGRINRQPFWIGMIILFVANALNGALFGYAILGTLIGFGLAYCGVCVCIKRCHDRGKSGWWCLLLLVPVVNIIWVVVDLGILEGDAGSNAWGPDPLRRALSTPD